MNNNLKPALERWRETKPTRRCDGPSATKYWLEIDLPACLTGVSMTQLSAIRKMVSKAFTDGRKAERKLK